MTTTLSVDPTADAPALTLRPWRETDIPALVAAYKDPAMRRWLYTVVDDEDGARAWLDLNERGWADGTRLTFVIEEDGRLVGHFLVKTSDIPGSSATEVGYWTLAEARGRGIASRCVEAVSQWLFGPQDRIAAEALELIHEAGNEASCRVANKSGYELESIVPASPPQYPNEGHRHVRARPPMPSGC